MKLALEICAPQNSVGPPLVFLHGFMGSRADWQAVRNFLDAEFTTVSCDLPGHGGQVEIPESLDSVPEVADWIHQELRRQLGRRYILVAYSMGGRVALHIALQEPDSLAGLLLCGASPGIEDAAERAARRKWDDAQAEAIESDYAAFLERWYQMPLFAKLRERAGFDTTRQRRLAQNPASLARVMRTLGSGRMQPLWHDLARFSVPSLFVAGSLDQKYCALAERFSAAVSVETPPVRAEIVEDCGHAVHLERPDRFADIVRRFCLILAEKDQGT